MSETFDLEAVSKEFDSLVESSPNAQEQIARRLQELVEAHGPEGIISVLEAAIPKGATIGEMIVYRSPQVTLLYGRVPAHFRSAIHNHTVWACIAQLTGLETSVVYVPRKDGQGLRVVQEVTSHPGGVTKLPKDAIHHIENPTDAVAGALHVYGGDFGAVEKDRSLWSHETHEREAFSFPKLLQLSVVAMKATGNTRGLESLVAAVPATRAMLDAT